MKNILECCDCLDHFCATCDFGYTQCPDCRAPLCEACSLDALDDRMCRCSTCHAPETATVAFPYTDADRKLYKNYTNPVKGCLDSD